MARKYLKATRRRNRFSKNNHKNRRWNREAKYHALKEIRNKGFDKTDLLSIYIVSLAVFGVALLLSVGIWSCRRNVENQKLLKKEVRSSSFPRISDLDRVNPARLIVPVT